MVIKLKEQALSTSNYFDGMAIKKQIVLGHTNCSWESNLAKWTNRLNGKYNKTAAYTINLQGEIFNHFDPSYYSDILGNIALDKKSIVILLENEGWLLKESESDSFINWVGHIYNKPNEVVEKKWRNYSYWAPYSKEQFESALKLVSILCTEFNIPKIVVSNHFKIDNLDEFSGVLYKSNIEKHYTDLSPAWDHDTFKDKLENEKDIQSQTSPKLD